jgi:hypothetical protein
MGDFAIIVLMDALTDGDASWTPSKAIPNRASVFVDPLWHGTFCVDSMRVPGAGAVVFLVHLEMTHTKWSALQDMMGAHCGARTMCNSVKVAALGSR